MPHDIEAEEEINLLQKEVQTLRYILNVIADEQKVYKGDNDYDIIPACDADEAQSLARFALGPGVNKLDDRIIEMDTALRMAYDLIVSEHSIYDDSGYTVDVSARKVFDAICEALGRRIV